MILTRRGFLRSIVPAAAAIAVAPTLLEELIDSGGPTIFLPPNGGWLGSAQGFTSSSLGAYLYSKKLAEIMRQSLLPLARFGDRLLIEPRASITTGQFTWSMVNDPIG